MNVKLPLVSVIVPVYNHELYIKECLDSIVNQDYLSLEIIILDDGSIDGSIKVVTDFIKTYQGNINIVYNTQKNQGVCKTLNNMLSLASGEYVCLCASDDALLPNSISMRIKYVIENNFDGVIGDAILMDEFSEKLSNSAMKKLYKSDFSRLQTNIIKELVINWSVVGPTFLTKKTVYDSCGLYDESLKIEDRDFFLRFMAKFNLGFIPEPVAMYRIHENNHSRKNSKSRFLVYQEVAASNVKNMNLYNGILHLFLKSYLIDKYICKMGYSYLSYLLIEFVRLIRKLVFKIL